MSLRDYCIQLVPYKEQSARSLIGLIELRMTSSPANVDLACPGEILIYIVTSYLQSVVQGSVYTQWIVVGLGVERPWSGVACYLNFAK